MAKNSRDILKFAVSSAVGVAIPATKGAKMLSSAVQAALNDVRNNQALSAAQQTQMFSALASAADRLDLGFAYVNTPSGFRAIGTADTPVSMANLAGIQHHLNIPPDRVLPILMTGGHDPEVAGQFTQIERYLGRAGEHTPRGQFETALKAEHRALFGRDEALGIEHWPMSDAEKVFAQRAQ